MTHPLLARDAVQRLRASPIREVANVGMGRAGVLPFWFGEPDEVTPQFIRDAANAALNAGETFYTQNLGIPPLRESIARYVSKWHQPIDVDRVAVTSSGVTALMLAMYETVNVVRLVGPVDPATCAPDALKVKLFAVAYGAVAVPIGALPVAFAPTLGVVLATRLRPNCSVP